VNLSYTPAEEAFRDEVRAFLHAMLPVEMRAKVDAHLPLTREEYVAWQRTLYEHGWGAPSWPKEFGGTGWTPVEQYIFEQECAAAGAPHSIPFGLKMVAPVLMAFGTPAQRTRFLPKILTGEHWWCQGYSEPGAGSDLASLSMQAVRDGDVYVVTGQKTWNTLGHYADWIFCLVRTAVTEKPQLGISFLLIDMRSPGITVRPIKTMDGLHEVNEIWFDKVRVPTGNLVGEENAGWTCAKFLLRHERANIAGLGGLKRELDLLKRIAAAERKHGRPLAGDARFAARIAEIEIELMALEITALRVLAAEAEQREPGPEVSLLKIKGTEIHQAVTELLIEAVGPQALPFGPGARDAIGPEYARRLNAYYLNMRKVSIYAGSNEIQRNLIAQTLLGL
jgi:alkylation response protein AidB-like acyl-CoA dehydrogenase